MDGYWLIWCYIIIIILYTCGYKQNLLLYFSRNEFILSFILILFLLTYNNVIYVSVDGTVQLHSSITWLLVFFVIFSFRNSLKEIGLFLISTVLLALIYSLIYVLFMTYRGYEPSMFEWLTLVLLILFTMIFVLHKHQLWMTVISTKALGDFILQWHQQGQFIAKIGDFVWWEFNFFIFITVICIVEVVSVIVKSFKIFMVNKMKS